MADGSHTKATSKVNLKTLEPSFREALDKFVMIPIFNSDCNSDEVKKNKQELMKPNKNLLIGLHLLVKQSHKKTSRLLEFHF
jgi:hypothetical protein